MFQPLPLCRTLYDYLNNPPTIRNIVVEVPKDTLTDEEDDMAMDHLHREEAVTEVRHALNMWYYS